VLLEKILKERGLAKVTWYLRTLPKTQKRPQSKLRTTFNEQKDLGGAMSPNLFWAYGMKNFLPRALANNKIG